MSLYWLLCIAILIGIIALLVFLIGVLMESSKGIIVGVALIFIAVISFVLYEVGNHQPTETNKTATEYIMCMEDSSLVSGRRSMYSGYINEEQYYIYMVILGDNSYVQNKILARGTIIHFTSENPRVEWYTETRHFLGYDNIVRTYQVVYVPEGSISTVYNIDCK